jgi:hypothetical protein
MHKYKAKGFYYNPATGEKTDKASKSKKYYYFASQYEWSVYQAITDHLPKHLVSKDVEIVLAQRGKDKIIYKVDFHLKPFDIFVEAKGFFTPIARLKTRLLSTNPIYDNRLVIVTESKPKFAYYHTVSLIQFKRWIAQKFQS